MESGFTIRSKLRENRGVLGMKLLGVIPNKTGFFRCLFAVDHARTAVHLGVVEIG